MLHELHIANLAIAHDVHLTFDEGLNVMTGETGAGKSILVRAISAVLGGKLTSDFISTGADSLRLEAEFSLPRSGRLRETLGDLVGDEDTTVVVTREVDRSGRHKYRINGRMVPISILRLVGENLVDVHGQHEPQSLLARENHLLMLDAFLGSDAVDARKSFAALLTELRAARRECESLEARRQQWDAETAFLEYALGELNGAQLVAGEEAELRAEQRLLENTRQLQEQVGQVLGTLAGDDTDDRAGTIRDTGRVRRVIEALCDIDPHLRESAAALEGAEASLKDAASSLSAAVERLNPDEARLAGVTQRLDTIVRLQEKYHHDLPGLLAYREQVEQKLRERAEGATNEQALRNRITSLEAELSATGARLTAQRKQGAPVLASRVEEQLHDLAMGNSRFVCSIEENVDDQGIRVGDESFRPTDTGFDTVEFLIAPNPGEGLRPLREIASGGELSRVMLALKTVFAQTDEIPTMVFDEVDQGIGGETGIAIATKLADLGRHHQVIVITHLPTIAARARKHLVIIKKQEEDATAVLVQEVAGDERVRELARMVSGDSITDIALAHARELLTS